MNIKECSNTLTLIKFKKQFLEESQGYRDLNTNKIYFCPHDLGFKFNMEDCIESKNCATCWNEAEDCMKFREKKNA